ncbi:hypothetical protein L6270_02145 [Candidatus Parcubacteria bacterium]|nr:hypothetical protein [Candidatus Parcubacteria bacterium]
MHERVMGACMIKALNVAKKAATLEEMIAIYKEEMRAFNAIESAKKTPDINTAIKIVRLKTGSVRSRSGKTGFMPEQGDLVRGAVEHFDGAYVPGLGIVNNENLANALGHDESSVVVAKGWRQREALTRDILDQQEVDNLLQAM